MSLNLAVRKICKCVQFNRLWPDKRKIWYICSTPNFLWYCGWVQRLVLIRFSINLLQRASLCRSFVPFVGHFHTCSTCITNFLSMSIHSYFVGFIWKILETALSQERFLKEDVNISSTKVQLYLCGGEVQKMMGHYSKVVSWWVGVVGGRWS